MKFESNYTFAYFFLLFLRKFWLTPGKKRLKAYK